MKEKFYTMQKQIDKNKESLIKYRLQRANEDLNTAKFLVKNNSFYGANTSF